jgi:hypothetical protein
MTKQIKILLDIEFIVIILFILKKTTTTTKKCSSQITTIFKQTFNYNFMISIKLSI